MKLRTYSGVMFVALIIIALQGLVFLVPAHSAGIIELPQTGQTTSYSAGDDGDFQAGAAWPVTGNMGTGRFNDNGDGSVTDLLTGLMWTKNANNGPVNFFTARNAAAALATGGHTDWRIPNMLELESLTHAGQADSAAWLISEGFTGVQSVEYWVSSIYVDAGNGGWSLNLGTDQTNYWLDWTAGTRHYWAVRGGANGAPDANYPANVPKTGRTISITAGDDGDLEWGVAQPSPRFNDRGDGTIFDALTGLQWPKDADILGGGTQTESLAAAMDYIADMNAGINPNFGYTDWRLPNKKEMYSLVHMDSDGTFNDEFSTDELAAAGFLIPNFLWCSHWTSTADPADPGNKVFGVAINTGGSQMLTHPLSVAGGCNWTYVPKYFWPVRGGVSACGDTRDNDGDGLTDYPDDPGCSSATDDDEAGFPPTVPMLVSPVNNQSGVDTTAQLTWEGSTDPDGDLVLYNLYVCEDADFTTGCINSTVFGSYSPADISYAGMVTDGKSLLILIVPALLIGSLIKKRKTVLPVIILISVVLLISCGNGGSGSSGGGPNVAADTPVSYSVAGLNAGTTYYWKVVADDGNGNQSSSSEWSFDTQ